MEYFVAVGGLEPPTFSLKAWTYITLANLQHLLFQLSYTAYRIFLYHSAKLCEAATLRFCYCIIPSALLVLALTVL